MDAQQVRGAALVAFAVVQYFHEQRDLDFAQHDFMQVVAAASIQIAEVAADGMRDMLTQRRVRCGWAVMHGV